MKKIVVTGGSGFIGTNLIDKLLQEQYSVLNLDKTKPVKAEQQQYWVETDILDSEKLEQQIVAFAPDIIVHLAAVTDLDGKTAEHYRANTDGTQHIIDVANKLPNLKKVIFTSSMYVCKPGYIPQSYDDYKPHTLYGESKVEGELLVKKLGRSAYDWVIVRPTSIWGPWFGIPYIDFFHVVYQGKYFDFGDTCTKTYGYVENTVHQLLKLIEAEDVHGKSFYLGDKPPIPIAEWANEVSVEMGKGKIKKIPFAAIQLAAWVGDALAAVNVKFPMTSFRLNNMRTNNVFPLDDIYAVTGDVPVNRIQGVKKTVKWLVDQKGYKI